MRPIFWLTSLWLPHRQKCAAGEHVLECDQLGGSRKCLFLRFGILDMCPCLSDVNLMCQFRMITFSLFSLSLSLFSFPSPLSLSSFSFLLCLCHFLVLSSPASLGISCTFRACDVWWVAFISSAARNRKRESVSSDDAKYRPQRYKGECLSFQGRLSNEN